MINSDFFRCGFVNDSAPRAVIRSLKYGSRPLIAWTRMDELYKVLKDLIDQMYLNFLAVNPRDRKVILVESVFCPTLFRTTLASVLLQHFNVPGIVFLPSHLMALNTLALHSALVVDVGYTECCVVPVIQNVTLMHATRFSNLGSKALQERVRQGLRHRALVSRRGEPPHEDEFFVQTLDEEVIEGIITKCCYVPDYKRGQLLVPFKAELMEAGTEHTEQFKEVEVTGPFPCDYQILGLTKIVVPGVIRDSVSQVFFEFSGHESNITTMIIEAISAAPIDCRKELASNIVLIGGTTMMEGFGARVCDELTNVVKLCPLYKDKIWFKEFKFHKLPCPANYASWLGSAIYASTDAIFNKTITCKEFEARGPAVLPDWSYWSPVPGRAQS